MSDGEIVLVSRGHHTADRFHRPLGQTTLSACGRFRQSDDLELLAREEAAAEGYEQCRNCSFSERAERREPDTDEETARWYAVLAERVSYDGRTSLRRYIRVTYARGDALRVFDVAYPESVSGGGVVPHPSHYRASIVDDLERAIDRETGDDAPTIGWLLYGLYGLNFEIGDAWLQVGRAIGEFMRADFVFQDGQRWRGRSLINEYRE